MSNLFKKWWRKLVYDPEDPRQFDGGKIKIAAIGGGTGLANLLRGLKKYSNEISAIVAVTDDGSSSGEIRREFDILPPGDIRKCISALANDEKMVSEILEYRFEKKKNGTLSNHTLGNIWITALTKYFGSFEKALEATTALFETSGKILPVTLDNIRLGAKYEDGTKKMGESEISLVGKRIKEVFLNKDRVLAYQKAKDAIADADLIVVGPGSLYTSVIPNFLVKGIRDAVKENKNALKIYVVNCSTEKGETEKYTVLDHLNALEKHAGKNIVDVCLVNDKIIKKAEKNALPDEIDNITASDNVFPSCEIATDDLVDEKNPLYHDKDKLAKSLIKLYNRIKRR